MAGFAGIFMIVVVVALSIAGAVTLYRIADAQKECSANSDCASESYCGSDFKCHIYPKIEVVKYDFAMTRPGIYSTNRPGEAKVSE